MTSQYSFPAITRMAKAGSQLLIALMVIGLTACEKQDFFDDVAITGNIGPQAYWEVGSSSVSAGTNAPFEIQYYTTNNEAIDRTEVWYNVTEIQEKSVSCGWVTSFSYSVNSIIAEQKRIEQKIQTFPHSLAVWSDSLHAYTYKASFPVSGTLKPFNWVKPESFDSTRMETYFGEGFMQQFKDSLYQLMKYVDFKNMMLGLSLVESFEQYTDTSFDANSNSEYYHFNKDSNGNMPVPAEITALYTSIPFDKLVESASGYNVEFKRNYYLEARMRVYDKQGVYGLTVLKKITIN